VTIAPVVQVPNQLPQRLLEIFLGHGSPIELRASLDQILGCGRGNVPDGCFIPNKERFLVEQNLFKELVSEFRYSLNLCIRAELHDLTLRVNVAV
jgi:hypothetical protein